MKSIPLQDTDLIAYLEQHKPTYLQCMMFKPETVMTVLYDATTSAERLAEIEQQSQNTDGLMVIFDDPNEADWYYSLYIHKSQNTFNDDFARLKDLIREFYDECDIQKWEERLL